MTNLSNVISVASNSLRVRTTNNTIQNISKIGNNILVKVVVGKLTYINVA